MATTATRLGPIAVQGGLWGTDLLAAIRDDTLDKAVAGTVTAAAYGRPKRASTEQAARAAWSTLRAAWEEFDDTHAVHVATAGTDQYGSDNFTWETWTSHLLDQLGYHPTRVKAGGLTVDQADPDDDHDRYPITHTHHGQVPLHCLPAGTPLDARTAGVRGAARQSPHSLVQDYLNRTDAHLWALVTNGLTLRLLRDNAAMSRQAYVEYDLAAIFEENDYPAFSLLWHTAHATRFVHPDDKPPATCIAESWQDHAVRTGVAALDDLRDGVEDAIAELGAGLLEHPDNTVLRRALDDPDDPFDAAALYRELLHVVYRHVFWFVLDDRDLLHPPDTDPDVRALYRDGYSSRVLRDKARRHLGGNHPDGWAHHQLVAGWFADPAGQPLLGIPALLGHLWEPAATAHVDVTTLTNRRYYEAVRRLAFVQRGCTLHRINYDAMGSDELGSVYESLLEVIPAVDTDRRIFTLVRTSGNERKTTGAYYTPNSLITVLLDDALDPVVQDRVDTALETLPASATADERRQAMEDAVLSVTVCDPAMGSAHFLVAAGWRLARSLAKIRTGEAEPAPDIVQQALRDVASRCLYGVDVNPMAVELAKVAIWLETHVPGQPLTFLDHHFKTGNSLVGIGFDRALTDWDPTASGAEDQGGVPDDAFKKLHGDDAKARTALMKANRTRRGGQLTLDMSANWHDDPTETLADKALGIAFVDDTTPEGLAAKEQAWMVYGTTDAYRREKLRADAWTATWTLPKTSEQAAAKDHPFDVYYDCHYNGLPAADRPGVLAAEAEAQRHRFFHWYLEFPEVAQAGGFGCMVGNPPWGTVATNAVSWFRARGYGDIADAATQSARDRMVDDLASSPSRADRETAAVWHRAEQDAAAVSHFLKASGRVAHGQSGTTELSAVFADQFSQSVRADGLAGLLCRESVATGKSNTDWLAWALDRQRLGAFYTFENEDKLFPGVDNTRKFAVAVVSGRNGAYGRIAITGFIRQPSDIDNPDRRYDLTVDEIRAINPHTANIPIFRHATDAAVTAAIHRNAPVMCPDSEDDPGPWGFHFAQGLFNMSSDSDRFVTAGQAEADCYTRDGTSYVREDGARLRPLHEGKMVWAHDYRYGTYEGQTQKQANKKVLPRPTPERRADPRGHPLHRYWIDAAAVEAELPPHWDRDWLIGFRDKGTVERTMLPAVLPRIAAGHSLPLLLPSNGTPRQCAFLLADLASLPWDFAARQKGIRMYKYVVQQTPTLSPPSEGQPSPWGDGSLLDFVVPRVVELNYTTDELEPFARDCGVSGTPFRWDEDRRTLIEAELHAIMFHLHGLDRDLTSQALDSFRLLRELEEKPTAKGGYGEFRTKHLVLERYDAMAKATATGEAYECPLDVPPADVAQHHR